KEITQLIDNIKEHSDYISDFERIPQVELDIIIAKIRKLHERTIIFNHEYEQEMLTRRIRKEPELKAKAETESPEAETATVAKPEAQYFQQNQVKQEIQAFMPTPEVPEVENPIQNAHPASNEEAQQIKDEPVFHEEVKFKEDNPEKKTLPAEPEKEQLTEDKPEEKLVKEEPGTHIYEQPVRKEEEPIFQEEEKFKEDVPEKKTMPAEPKKEQLTEGKPEEKLVKEEPGTHIYEQPVRKEEEPIKKEQAEQEKARKAELHERLKSATENGSVNDRIGQSKIYSDLSNRLQKNPISDLTRAIGLNEKFLYIKDLFNNDSAAFMEALNELNSFGNYAAAEHFLSDNLASKFNWEKNSETVAKFTELVQRRYL
nr:hypothetical protein [Bacteroidota bacterium]